jgi:cyclopropane-fatty-acyl-phospholipid synthase
MADRPKTSPVNFLKIVNKIQHALRSNTKDGSRKNISEHYDLGNEFFSLFLDPSMAYSSAYFTNAKESLHQAQINKYDLLCQKLKLTDRDHLLEIGSGWGGLAMHAAQNYGCRVTTVTISKQQHAFVSEKVFERGLKDFIDVKFMDYRDIKGQFDKIVSVEMIEAVGHKFMKTFFVQCHALLKKDGLLALQMILSPDHRYESFRKNVDWIQKHIFPGSLLPSMQVIQSSIRETGNLMLYDFEDMTPSYAQTLKIWREGFNQNLSAVRDMGFEEEFIRKWNYYKSYCEAAFKTRNISVVQAVFTRPNNLVL